MSFEANIAGLLDFLDWMAEKGLAPANTASSRKAAANKVISSLGEDEASNVLAIDIDDAIQRFAIKHGGRYSTESLQSYKSRVKTALEDFAAYKADPVGFRPAGRSMTSLKKSTMTKATVRLKRPPQKATASPNSAPISAASNQGNVVPVPIREEVTVKIGNLPYDLTPDEAKKIANVILAYGGALS